MDLKFIYILNVSQAHFWKQTKFMYANHDWIQLLSRYTNQVSVGNKVLVNVNDKLIPTKVIKIASMKVQGIHLCNTLNFFLFFSFCNKYKVIKGWTMILTWICYAHIATRLNIIRLYHKGYMPLFYTLLKENVMHIACSIFTSTCELSNQCSVIIWIGSHHPP